MIFAAAEFDDVNGVSASGLFEIDEIGKRKEGKKRTGRSSSRRRRHRRRREK